MPLALWCQKCSMALCRACATQDSHLNHPTKSLSEAKEQLITEVSLAKYQRVRLPVICHASNDGMSSCFCCILDLNRYGNPKTFVNYL